MDMKTVSLNSIMCPDIIPLNDKELAWHVMLQ